MGAGSGVLATGAGAGLVGSGMGWLASGLTGSEGVEELEGMGRVFEGSMASGCGSGLGSGTGLKPEFFLSESRVLLSNRPVMGRPFLRW